MRKYKLGSSFKIIATTQHTLLGADISKFTARYANVDNMDDWTIVSGEFVESSDNQNINGTAIAKATPAGARVIQVLEPHTIKAGDAIKYGDGKFVYVLNTTPTTLTLKRSIKQAIPADYAITTVSNLGDYITPAILIEDVGEYAVVVEAPEYNVVAQTRVDISEADVFGGNGGAIVDDVITVAY